MNRHLAAVLAADIVGYSHLMKADEVGTLAALRRFRAEVLRAAIADSGGDMVKSMGDGWLVEFASVADAATCALGLQVRLAGDPVIRLRIGIHIGDITRDDEDIFGDGVNVASRLQELAEPGGIAISDTAHSSLDGTLAPRFRDSGEHRLKNIARPAQVWICDPEGPVEATQPPASAAKPSIAILPFANISGDPSQDYFSDGISEEILTALSRCRWLRVVARNSSFSYRGKSVDIRQIARELRVRYLLEGSVRRTGERVRISAQLADGSDGSSLWSSRYNHDVEDIFDLQEEIAGTIAGTIEPELGVIEWSALRGQPTKDLNAWDSYQRGLWHLYRFSLDELMTAKALFERAIELDPMLAQAYARLGYVHIQLGFYGPWEERPRRLDEAIALAGHAVELDDREPAGRVSLGRALALRGNARDGIAELRAAIELDPSFAQAHFALAQAHCYVNDAEEALHEINHALRLSPRDPHLWTFLNIRAVAHYIAGNLTEAEADERAALRQPNTTFWSAMILVAVLGRAVKPKEAREAIAELERLRPGMTVTLALRELYFGETSYQHPDFHEQFAADLRAAGLPEA